MCGILGQLNRNGEPVDIGRLVAANNLQRHRGPDDEGYFLLNTAIGESHHCKGDDSPRNSRLPHINEFAGGHFDLVLGHRRLSIQDTSSLGHQPMSNARGDLVIVFNGEVYNFPELRKELESIGHHFETATDTEVILSAYEEWGKECVARFNGMWAFTILDLRNAEPLLWISRDRLGIKPLNYIEGGKTFSFGSEFKSLFCLSGLSPAADDIYTLLFLAKSSYPEDSSGDTFFKGVRKLPPGNNLEIRSGKGIRLTRFWSLSDIQLSSEPIVAGEVIEELQSLLSDAVNLRLRADVSVGSCLSGGIDSSGIVGLATRHLAEANASAKFNTFSAVYDSEGRYNERYFIDLVSKHYQTASHYTYPTAEKLTRDLDRLVYHQEEPFSTTSIFAQWCVMEEAQCQNTPVLLDGQAADELYGGYLPFAVLLRQIIDSEGYLAGMRALREMRKTSGFGLSDFVIKSAKSRGILSVDKARGFHGQCGYYRYLSPRLLGSVDGKEYAGYIERRFRNVINCRSLEDSLRSMVSDFNLGRLLHWEDRNSMAFSREARVPFTDFRLVEHAFRRATDYKLKEGWTKWVLRKAVSGVVPNEVCWRKDKVGFETPEHEFVPEVYRDREERLMDPASRIGEFCDVRRLYKLGRFVLARKKVTLTHYRNLWRILCLQSWIDGDLFKVEKH